MGIPPRFCLWFCSQVCEVCTGISLRSLIFFPYKCSSMPTLPGKTGQMFPFANRESSLRSKIFPLFLKNFNPPESARYLLWEVPCHLNPTYAEIQGHLPELSTPSAHSAMDKSWISLICAPSLSMENGFSLGIFGLI